MTHHQAFDLLVLVIGFAGAFFGVGVLLAATTLVIDARARARARR